MPDFVALADLLRGDPAPPAPEAPLPAAEPPPESPMLADALREARLFRARLADAFDAGAERLLRELAARVLGRELRLAPCALDALLRETLAQAPVLRVRVAAPDVDLALDVPVVADATLQPGDAILELHDGALDARLGVRLAAVLEAFA